MDEPTDSHTEWSKSKDKDKYHLILFIEVESKKNWYKGTYLQSSHICRNQSTVIKEENGRHKLGDWDWYIHTTVYKTDN